MSLFNFSGALVRLCAVDIEKDTEVFARWSRNSEYQRLLDTGPGNLWAPKQVRVFYEENIAEMNSFVIRTLVDDRLIGMVDLSGFDWVAGSAWVGIGIGEPGDWGKGYGTDAMRVLLRFAFAGLNLHRVNLNVFGYNERAVRSYLKCGFKEEGRQRQFLNRDDRRWDLIFMGILKEEWEALDSSNERSE